MDSWNTSNVISMVTIVKIGGSLHSKGLTKNLFEDIKNFSKQLNVPLSYFYKDSFGSISKKFFKGKMAFPTIIGIRGNEYLFRFNGIDKTKLDEIKSLL